MTRIGLVSMSSMLSSRKDFLKGAFGLAALSAAGCAFGFAPSAPLTSLGTSGRPIATEFKASGGRTA